MAAPTNSKPSLLDRAIAVVSPTLALERADARSRLVMFGYDAAHPGVKRGGSGGMSKNSGSESPKMAMDRVKLMWEARDLERNMPVIRCYLDRTAQYVTSQVLYQSQTGDPQWDSLAEGILQRWMQDDADITGRRNFRMLVEMGFRSMLRDGDFGFHLVRNGPKLQIQCIESDRIGDPNKVAAFTTEHYVQGIHLNDFGMPTGYDLYKRDRRCARYEFEIKADAKNFFLLSKPLRTDEYRSVSVLAPIVAQARDLYEMFAFERGAAKWAASHAGVIRVADPLAKSGAGSAGLWDGTSTDSKGNPTEVIEASKLLRLRPNEDVTSFASGSRAAGAFMQYVEVALRDIAMGLNTPYGFFNMSQFGGATVRLEAMQLQRTFARYQELLTSSVLEKIKDKVLQNAIALGQLPPNPNYRQGRWQFGKHLTADTGYDTTANLELLRNGLKTASTIAGEEGYDFEDMVDAQIREAITIRDKCAAAGVPVEMIAADRYPDATNQLAAASEAMQPQATTVQDLGPNAKVLTDLLEKVAAGLLPREEAVALLVEVFEIDPATAEAIVPEVQPIAVEANKPAPSWGGGGGKPKPAGEDKPEAPKVDSSKKP